MAFARDTYTASASQTDFTITFSYLAEEDVLVYEDGVLQTEGASNDYTIVTSTIVRFNSGRTSGVTIVLVRTTSQSTRLVDYTTASTLTEEDLDNDSLQAFYMAQEAIDSVNTGLNQGNAGKWDFQSIQSENVPTPTAGDGIVSKNYVDALVVAAGNVPTPDASEDGYVITADAVGGWDWQDSTTQWTIFEYSATGGQTSFTGADRNANTMAFTSGDILVFLNGILLSEGASLDYTVTGGTTVTLSTGANVGDVLRVFTMPSNVILTNAQTQTVADARYLQITNDLSEVTAATALNNITPTSASGDILYYNGTNWVVLAKGSDDEVLTLASGLPSWASGGLLRVQDTEQSTASGTSKSWTKPAGISVVEKIEICFDGLSLDGTDQLLAQIGNTTVETSGYFSTSADTVTEVHSTAGFVLRTVAAATLGGLMTLTHFGGNQWVYAGAGANQSNNSVSGGGSKGALSGVMDIVTLKPSGSNNFDAGVANVIWYGS